MKALPDGCVDAVITDPPYGIGFNYGTGYADKESAYPELIQLLVCEARRLSVLVGIFQAAKYAPRWSAWFGNEWRLVALPKLFGQWMPCHIQWRTDYLVLVGGVSKGKRLWDMTCSERDFFVSTDVCRTQGVGDHSRTAHPCPRPLDSMEYLSELLCPPNGVILDPFLGSGTTAVAAKKLGRHFLGFEISEEYCRIARERIALVEAQPNLFEKQPEQLEFEGKA
jgi:DNA modification methylase